MTRSLRLLVSAAGLLALAFPAGALAAYDPSLIIAHTNQALGARGSVVIGLGQGENDDATASMTLYTPPGYRVTLGQAPGTQLGTLSGFVKVGALGGSRQEVRGVVRADNPANHVTNTCAPGVHEAVWILEFQLLGNTFRGPVFVDRITGGPEAAYGSARIVACLPSPYVPPPQGAPSGATLLAAAFDVRGVFTSPTRRGSYAWNAVFVPYTPGTATPNTPNSAQSTAITRLPVQLSATLRRQKRGKLTFANVTACVKEAGAGVRGIRVVFLSGRSVSRTTRAATGRTNARGCARVRIRVKSGTRIVVAFVDEVPARQAGNCRPTLVPRCTGAATAPVFDLFRILRVRR